VALDIDGTLLDSQWRLPDENLKAIRETLAAGVDIVLATGRRYEFTKQVASQLPPEVKLIVCNGALVKSQDGTTHMRQLLPKEIARQVLMATRDHRTGTAVVFDRPREGQVIFEKLDLTDATREKYYERNREFIGWRTPLEDCLDEDPIEVMFSGACAEMRGVASLLKKLENSSAITIGMAEYQERNFTLMDVVRRGCTKGSALEEWCALQGYKRAEVMAIGDNWNDCEMLEFAGVPVVMRNAVEGLKSRGWAVTLSNDECGVATALRRYAI
jgi:Cof subfamily protein (haloacid dehalogenase superfamily)